MNVNNIGRVSSLHVATFCALCGSEIAPYMFKGKHICPSCLDYVKEYL